MNVDLKEIEQTVVTELSGKIRARVKGDRAASELSIAIVEITAEVITLYLQEFLKATNQK